MFSAIPIAIPMTFITEIEKSTLKIIWKQHETENSQGNMSKKSNARGNKTPNFKLYYRVIAIKTALYWHKNRCEDQWNRIQNPDMDPCY
jgi:hypothetical protein